MNRSSILRQALSFVGVLLFAAACGPRMKPVEYEEPSKDLSSSSGDSDEGSSSSSSGSSSSSSSGSASSSDSSSSSAQSATASSGSCKEKKCGQACTECPAGDESCMEVLLSKQCNLQGQCVPAPVDCSAPKKSKDKEKAAK